jgi:hypothetical protein
MIGATRLEDLTVAQAADALDVTVRTVLAWRRAAEARLVTAIAEGDLEHVTPRVPRRTPHPAGLTATAVRRLRRRQQAHASPATALAILAVTTAAPAWAVNDLPTIVGNLRNWIMGILAALATLFLTIGGVRYLMAGGDPGEVERAKAAFRSAGIGYVLAAIAPVVLTVLKGIIGA